MSLEWEHVIVHSPHPIALHQVWDDIVESAHLEVVPVPPLAPNLDFERSPDGLADLLTRVSLVSVEALTVRNVHRVDAKVWWSGPARGIASIGAIVESRTPIVVARLKAQYDRLSRRYLARDGLLHLPTAAVLAYTQVP